MSAVLFREHQTTFGPYLRELRVGRGLSLRDAAGRLGITFAKLQKMEKGGRFRIVSPALFDALADLYARPVAEVLAKAGLRFDLPTPSRPVQLALVVEPRPGEDLAASLNARFAEGWRFVAAVPVPLASLFVPPSVPSPILVVLER